MLAPKTPGRRAEAARDHREAPTGDIVRMRVVLIDVVPPIWRRLQVPAEYTLRRLHTVLQHAVGWKNLHPHRFRVGTESYGMPSETTEQVRDSRWISLREVASSGVRALTYEYAFPDGWTHEIRIESVGEGGPGSARPVCLGGERACPPESAGGPDGYVDGLLAGAGALDRSDPPDWLRHGFDPERFDLEAANAALAAVK
jgi:Plasmid pRiA4b ORF-3-like protein